MNDNRPEAKRGDGSADTEPKSEGLTSPAMEQERRRQQVEREARQTGAGANDPNETVNQDG